jgi:hypothetical protein
MASHGTADLGAAMPHIPHNCYRVHGWTIVNDDWRTDGDRRYRLMIVEIGGARAAVAYWYQLGSDVVSDRDELRTIFQKLRRQGQAWPGIVKVMIHIPIDFSEADAKAAAEELGAGIYEWIRTHT